MAGVGSASGGRGCCTARSGVARSVSLGGGRVCADAGCDGAKPPAASIGARPMPGSERLSVSWPEVPRCTGLGPPVLGRAEQVVQLEVLDLVGHCGRCGCRPGWPGGDPACKASPPRPEGCAGSGPTCAVSGAAGCTISAGGCWVAVIG